MRPHRNETADLDGIVIAPKMSTLNDELNDKIGAYNR